MMNPNFYIGKSLEDLAKRTGHNHGGYAVYLLANPSDTTGWAIGEDYYIRDLVRRFPDLRGCVVKRAYDYYGQYILRVYRPRKTHKPPNPQNGR